MKFAEFVCHSIVGKIINNCNGIVAKLLPINSGKTFIETLPASVIDNDDIQFHVLQQCI